jgi:type VI secretion system protein ImpA
VHRTDAVLVIQAGTETGTNFAPIYGVLAAIGAAIRVFVPEEIIVEDEWIDTDEQEMPEAASKAKTIAAVVRDRDDVRRMLDLLVDYYARHEPSSPVPLLLTRARAWVELNFMDVLGDIAPVALTDAKMLLEFREAP